MHFIFQSARLIDEMPAQEVLKGIEYAGRTCYASRDRITDSSCSRFIKNLIKRCHEAPLEFGSLTFEIVTSRAVLAEITRHRLASFCVESQRYVKANDNEISFIWPEWIVSSPEDFNNGKTCPIGSSIIWAETMAMCENAYSKILEATGSPEIAREVLPNSTATRIVMKANIREWRHFFSLRCDKAAYPQMRSLAKEMLSVAYEKFPDLFFDLYEKYISEELSNDNSILSPELSEMQSDRREVKTE